jgi:hypothetical protein
MFNSWRSPGSVEVRRIVWPAGDRAATPLIACLLMLCPAVWAQPWSGIVAPSRAIDWSNAGTAIPINWPACTSAQAGTAVPIPSTASASTINSALSACSSAAPNGSYLSLGAGTFNLSGSINFSSNNVILRGQGANQTFLVFGAVGSTNINANGSNAWIGGGEQNVCDWTAGYAPGSTSITLANCGSTTPAMGNISNLHVGSLLMLDQTDEASDTGQIWNCATQGSCANTIQSGFDRTNGPSVNGVSLRSQEQGAIVQSISGSGPWTITISPGVYMPNWRSGQAPQAFYANRYLNQIGVENLSVDGSNSSSGSHNIGFQNCTNCWVKGVRSLVAGRSHISIFWASHCVVRDSYFYESQSHYAVSYGVELENTFDSLVENNIGQQITDSLPNTGGPAEGNVFAYNFGLDDVFVTAGWMQATFYQHAAGDAFGLWEGNIGTGYNSDDVHGTHHFETLFRNYLPGTQAAGCGGAGLNTCTAQTTPVHLYAGSRYMNVIGNVLGKAGYHNQYTYLGSSSGSGNPATTDIYVLGATGNSGNVDTGITGFCLQPACTSHGSYDPQVSASLFRWGNYDLMNGANPLNTNDTTGVRFVVSEVPSGISPYANAVPSTQTLPVSLYLSGKPSWFGSIPFPPIGSDVTGGNITSAGSILGSSVGGHVNMNPAMNCYINVMGGPADGTGNALSFNANACYGSATPPAAPTSLRTSVK